MKVSVFKKAVSAVIVLSMLFGILPSTNVFAATVAGEYTYQIRVKNGNVKYAGTDNDVYCIVESVGGARFQIKIDSGADDFERNDDRTYNVDLELQPWEIKYIGLKNGGKDGAYFAWFKFRLPNGTWVHQDVNEWFEKGYTDEHKYLLWVQTDRQVSSRDNFDNNFSGTKYFDAAATTANNIVMEWSGKVSDQYFSNYNMFDYAGAVGVTFYATGKSYGYSSISSVSQMEDNNLAQVGSKQGFDNKLTLKMNELLRFMKTNKIYKLDIKSEIDYDGNYDEYGSHYENYTIYRKGFELEGASATTAAYVPEKDNNFYNSENRYKTFEIKIPVKSMDNYNATTIAASLASNIKSGASTAKIYYGALNKNEYVTPHTVYSSGANIYLKCDAPAGFANNDDIGITAVIENAKATYNGQTYMLDRENARYEYYISTHKVDTKGLTHTLKDESDNTVTSFNTYKKEHKFKLSVDAGEDIYIDNTKGGRSEGYFSYRLYNKDMKTEIPLVKHNGISATSLVPHAGNSVYRVASTEKVEGEYKLEVASRDFANNLSKTTYDVKLDTIAPRATYTLKEVKGVDGSKSNQYKFNITDASGTGRLNYVFVYNGDDVPDADTNPPASSGSVNSEIGRWAFIDQKNTNAQTAVLYLQEGKFFKGRLYWYTVDDAGNDSRTENNRGAVNGLYYTDIVLNNVKADCEIKLDDITPGKPEYEIDFETSSHNKVEYRWIGKNTSTNLTKYTSSSEPGAASQKDSSGNIITMNGEYTLEYVVITPDGARTTYEREFLFDNTNPSIGIDVEKTVTSPTRKMNITVQDISNIESLKYQLYTAGGEEVGEEIELGAGLPVVSEEITISPENTGAYKIKVTAKDINGQTTEAESDVFSIRNAAPEIAAVEDISARINGVAITNSQNYTISIEVNESVTDTEHFAEDQVLRYRTSDDGVNYSDWVTVSDIHRNADGISASATIPSPVALNDGDNRVFIQAAFTDKGADVSKIRNELIATNSEALIIYDTQAPLYKLSINNSDMTNKSVEGTVTYMDNYTAADVIDVSWQEPDNYLNVTNGSETEESAVKNITVWANTEDGLITLTDIAGNKAEIPIVVNCIDYSPPYWELQDSYESYSGERKDYYLSFTVDEALEGETKFALVEGATEYESVDPGDTSAPVDTSIPIVQPYEIEDNLFGPMPENIDVLNTQVEYDYENGERKTLYELMVRGGEGKENTTPEPEMEDYLTAEYTQAYNDWVANGSIPENEPDKDYYIDYEAYYAAYDEWELSDYKLNNKSYVFAVKSSDTLGNTTKDGLTVKVKNVAARINELACSPQKAYTETALIVGTNVPVYILPQDKVPAEITVLNLPDGRLDNSDNAVVTAFAEDVINQVTGYSTSSAFIIDSIGNKAVYFADECDRVYKQTVMVKDISEDNGMYDAVTAYVSFGNEAPADVKLYRASGDNTDMSSWTELNASQTEVLDFESGYKYYVVVTPKPGANQTVTLTDGYVSDADDDYDYSVNYELTEGDYYNGYTRLVYDVNNTSSVNKILSYTAYIETTDPSGVAEPVYDEVGGVFELELKDATGPEIDVAYSTKGYTNKDVVVTVSATDPELMVNTDAADTNNGTDTTEGAEAELKTFTDEQNAENAGIDSIELVEASDPSVTAENHGNYITLTFAENGSARVKVTNTLGLVSYEDILVENINKAAIEAGTHYNIKYFVRTPTGETEVDPDAYYKDVIARVEFTQEGSNERELYVSNNMGETAKNLNSFDNEFTFTLKDKFGNTVDVKASFEKFDLNGPDISYELSNPGKTNQPYDVYLGISDLLTEVDTQPSVTAPDGTQLGVTFVGDETDAGTGVVTKTYKTTISASGIYKVAATDVLGNVSYKNFTVSNIDTTLPVVTEKMATSTKPTRQTVGVKLYYSKPGVVITRAEGVTVAEKDFVVDHNNSAIRFNENGTVAVEFVDEYGNIGTDMVNVTNINRTPPSIKAVVTPSADLLSVSVSFEQQTDGSGVTIDTKRQLSEIYTLYGGITPVRTELDEDGNEVDRVLNASEVKYTFVENGTYTVQAYDSIGNIQEIDVEVTQIDRRAPVITNVAWAYKYLDENGIEQTVNYSVTPGNEAGYNIVEDETYKPTNQDITATVTTDLATRFVGSASDEYNTQNSIVYSEDGWFNFNLERQNRLMDRYGLGLYLIDKEPPVIEEVEDLMFFENPNAGTPYDKALLKYSAYDERYGEKTVLTDKVEIDWGGFNPDDISANTFDRSKPYTITYTVKDKVGNVTSVQRKITLVGLFDSIARVNGIYPDSSGRIEVVGDSVEIGIDNFSGTSYARYEKGIHTMGEMKHIGTVIPKDGDKFKLERLSEGWYTFYVQTDLRDYFCINVYIYNR